MPTAPPVVIDASAMTEILRRTTAGKRAATAVEGAALAAPSHLDAEVLSALARLARDNPADEPLVTPRLQLLARAPIARYPCAPLLAAAWDLRANIAVRDALYVALTLTLEATLVTADARLARVPKKVMQIPIHVV
jgi:predicted nucleic acid-binding protein